MSQQIYRLSLFMLLMFLLALSACSNHTGAENSRASTADPTSFSQLVPMNACEHPGGNSFICYYSEIHTVDTQATIVSPRLSACRQIGSTVKDSDPEKRIGYAFICGLLGIVGGIDVSHPDLTNLSYCKALACKGSIYGHYYELYMDREIIVFNAKQ